MAKVTPPATSEFWSENGLVLRAGDFGHPENNGQLWFADSEIVHLSDGRLRIYMYNGSASGRTGAINSMVSSDGLHWSLEPGTRCSVAGPRTCGQIGVVPLPSGGWRIFSSEEGGIGSATSRDGLTWSDDPGWRVSAQSVPGAAGDVLSGPRLVALSSGGWRMYFHQANPEWFPGNTRVPSSRVLSAFSTDLLHWSVDSGVRATGLMHPYVIALPAGGYQMFAHAGFDILTATSVDGLTWPATFDRTGLQGGDVVPVLLSGAKIRLYYNDADARARQGGGLFWAEQESATWDVTFVAPDRIDVIGSGGPVRVRLTDHGRSQDRPFAGLPFIGKPFFEVRAQVPGQLPYQPLIEVSDGTMNRYFDPYDCGASQYQWPCAVGPPPA